MAPPKAANPELKDNERHDEDDLVLDLEELHPKRPAVLFRTAKEREESKPKHRYEVLAPQELGIEEEHLYRSELGEFSELMNKRDLNSKERAKLRARLDSLFQKALIAPAAVKKQFADRDKQKIMALFTTALLTEDATAVEQALPITTQLARAASITGS